MPVHVLRRICAGAFTMFVATLLGLAFLVGTGASGLWQFATVIVMVGSIGTVVGTKNWIDDYEGSAPSSPPPPPTQSPPSGGLKAVPNDESDGEPEWSR